jgi:hypothetical protein
MVSVSESLEMLHAFNHPLDESAADSSCSVGKISGLIVTE